MENQGLIVHEKESGNLYHITWEDIKELIALKVEF
jgi:hypothetical protein